MEEAEKLGSNVNCGTNRFNAFISADESYIIVPALGMEDSYGGVDYYIVFRDKDDNWIVINMWQTPHIQLFISLSGTINLLASHIFNRSMMYISKKNN